MYLSQTGVVCYHIENDLQITKEVKLYLNDGARCMVVKEDPSIVVDDIAMAG